MSTPSTQSTTSTTSTCFTSESDFCSDCGSVLPPPGVSDTVTCRCCSHRTQIDRRCSRCGHEKMVYYTRQMRSADEGQTVFYTCVQCRFQEKEDS
uniref:DNA-directed RNA polymerase I subunit RPA12 n=1 Tax=Pyxicephalus adspersus TaxID=30357 RepID=A0AAV3B0C5_PYXAD|nr:TPA: hypothetical protein GDO54_007304 [Pyxicephalus adspersus]